MALNVLILSLVFFGFASAGPSGSQMSQASGAISGWVDSIMEMITGKSYFDVTAICPDQSDLDCDVDDQILPWLGWCFECSDDGYIYALCDMTGNTAENETYYTANGKIVMRQMLNGSSDIEIKVSVKDVLPVGTQHGFHIHQEADISQGCTGAGSHYNPYNQDHGAPTDDIRHVGDWGNVNANDTGYITTTLTDTVAALVGPFPIFGRAIVLHAMEDDLGRGNYTDSLTTGHAGARLGCCVIGHAESDVWDSI